MTSDISIFDIPHITERIGLYLDRKDRQSCSLVTKAFHKEFNRILWRELIFRSLTQPLGIDIEPDRKEALFNNAQWTREIMIDTNCRVGVLPLLSEACTLLRSLSVYVTSTQEDDPDMILSSLVIDWITRNTRLKTYSFLCYAGLSTNSFGMLLGAFSQASCLYELVLVFQVFPPPRGWFNCVLQSLPKTLKLLSLQWKRLSGHGETMSLPAREWPESYPYLEVAKLMVELSDHEKHALYRFLELCPALKECHFPRMTSDTLSDFVVLLGTKRFPFTLTRLDCRKWDEMSEQQWKHFLWAMKDHVRSFIIGIDFATTFTQHYVLEMTKSWSRTLEDVFIYNSHLISSQDIQLILKTCPKLKKFNCMCYWLLMIQPPPPDGSIPLPGLLAMSSHEDGANDDETANNWVCLELEELKITFADARITPVDSDTSSQQEQKTVQGIKQVYKQLGRLAKLKELTLGWCTVTTFINDANLDMSLKSGLEHMKELKSLRKIDVTFIAEISIDIAEAQWMLANWPALKEIDGLEYRYKCFEVSVQEPSYVTLMKSERPWLVIT